MQPNLNPISVNSTTTSRIVASEASRRQNIGQIPRLPVKLVYNPLMTPFLFPFSNKFVNFQVCKLSNLTFKHLVVYLCSNSSVFKRSDVIF